LMTGSDQHLERRTLSGDAFADPGVAWKHDLTNPQV
jgi:hypothetical protein